VTTVNFSFPCSFGRLVSIRGATHNLGQSCQRRHQRRGRVPRTVDGVQHQHEAEVVAALAILEQAAQLNVELRQRLAASADPMGVIVVLLLQGLGDGRNNALEQMPRRDAAARVDDGVAQRRYVRREAGEEALGDARLACSFDAVEGEGAAERCRGLRRKQKDTSVSHRLSFYRLLMLGGGVSYVQQRAECSYLPLPAWEALQHRR
jgi:hypothetical protein